VTTQLDAVRERLGGRRRVRPGPPHVIGVVSGRGGSGTSMVAALLAIRSARAGLRVLLVDADPLIDVQRVWLGLGRRSAWDEQEFRQRGAESLVTQVFGGLELLSLGGSDSTELEPRVLMRRVPSIFAERDIVIVDAGTRLQSLERCFDLKVGSLLVVSDAEAIGLASTHALLKAIALRSDLSASVLFNRVDRESARAGESVLRDGGRRFMGFEPSAVGYLPEDTGVSERMAGGAALPECLVESSLPELAAGVMPNLRPWAHA